MRKPVRQQLLISWLWLLILAGLLPVLFTITKAQSNPEATTDNPLFTPTTPSPTALPVEIPITTVVPEVLTEVPPATTIPTVLPTEISPETPALPEVPITIPTAAAPTEVSSDIPAVTEAPTTIPTMLSDGTPEVTLMVIELPATELPTVEVTAMPTPAATTESLPTEPPLTLLFADTFDTGALDLWKLGAGWSLVKSEGGQALQVMNSEEAATFAHDNLFNVAVQARFLFTTGTARLSIRQNSVGSYNASLSADGRVVLYRVDQLLQDATVSLIPTNQGHLLRLSAMDGILRVAVDGVEAIAVRDDAPLPPGTVALAAGEVGTGVLLVDDVSVWVPSGEVPIQPTIAPTVTPTNFDLTKVGDGVMETLQTTGWATVIIKLYDPVSIDAPSTTRMAAIAKVQNSVLARLQTGDFEIIYQYSHVSALAGRITERGLRMLLTDPSVEFVQLDELGHGPLGNSVSALGADVVHSYGVTGQGVTVAILDSGIDTDHPELQDDIVAQKCFNSNPNDCPPNHTAQGDSAEDTQGHGTGVSGVITSPNGFAPAAKIIAVRVLNSQNSLWISDLVAGLDWLLDQNINVINMSLGTKTTYAGQCDVQEPTLSSAVNLLYNKGVVIFAATGNMGSSTQIAAPACLSHVIAVGATYDSDVGRAPDTGTFLTRIGPDFADCHDANARTDAITCFTNSNSNMDIVAPGYQIHSSDIGGRQLWWAGTSFASPTAAGIAALMLQVNPHLTPDQIESILKSTGTEVTDNRNGIKFPRINAKLAVKPITSNLVSPPDTSMVNDAATPLFSWSQVPYANGYQLQVATDANFTNKIVDIPITTPFYTPTVALTNITYFWRVQAVTAWDARSEWSNSYHFALSHGGVAIEKSIYSIENGIVIFKIHVSNASSQALHNINISDPLTPNCNAHIDILTSGYGSSSERFYGCTYTATQDFTNIITVTAVTDSGTLVADNAAVFVNSNPDDDIDGIDDTVEAGAPNNGDGNNDGIPDSQQNNVASLPNAVDGKYVTLSSPLGTALTEVTANPVPAGLPAGVTLPVGIIDFTLQASGAKQVKLYLPTGTSISTYYKYGRQQLSQSPQWYDFYYNAATGTGVQISGVVVTLNLVDGQRGDDDLSANGLIVDPGAPAFISGQPPLMNLAHTSVTVNEGQTATNTITVNNTRSEPITLTSSIGTLTDRGNSIWDWSFVTDDGPSQSQSVTIHAADGQSGATEVAFDLMVNNVAPTADFVNTSDTIMAGQAAKLVFRNSRDASLTDTRVGFTYSYDCTNDGSFELEDSTSALFTCPYTTGSTFAAVGRIKDKDGGFTDYATTIQVAQTITVKVTAGTDDVNEDGANYAPYERVIWIGTGKTGNQSFTGLRFNQLNLPPGAKIIEARLELYEPLLGLPQLDLSIAAEASDSSATFRSNSRPSQRSLTVSKVDYHSHTLWLPGNWYKLGGIKTVIQEVVNRAGWQSGNSLSLILKGIGSQWSRKFVSSYDGDPNHAPRLVIIYTVP